MRWSQAHIPTLRDDPADAEAPSHRLLLRGGYIRQLMAGAYSLLPLAIRVRAKIATIIREEMDGIGAQEFLLPALHPGELWQKSGRWEVMGENLFRLLDRRGTDLALGMTHEEVFSTLAQELSSYRDLPQVWYQIQTKFRDEPRPKSGVLRTREFTMKDAYTFDIDDEGLDAAFERQREAYIRIFARMGLNAIPVTASSGAMGGSTSMEFVVQADAGEDLIVLCPKGDYAANMERGESRLTVIEDDAGPPQPERFDTPGIRTIKALEEFEGGAPAERQIKTMAYIVDGELTLALLRGDHELVEQKLLDAAGASELRPAEPTEVQAALGALPGSLGGVGVTGHRIIADEALRGRRNLTTGANQDDVHLRGVDVERDIEVTKWADLRSVRGGEPCRECGTALAVVPGIEVGHIFKLGRKYAEAFGLEVLDHEGVARTITMGSYGIGLERGMAAIVETHHDEAGIVWPVAVAPFEVVVTVIRPEDQDTLITAEQIVAELEEAGIETLLDDREERPGVKFADAELIGVPYRITVGPRGLEQGLVELTSRASRESEEVPVAKVAARVADQVMAERS